MWLLGFRLPAYLTHTSSFSELRNMQHKGCLQWHKMCSLPSVLGTISPGSQHQLGVMFREPTFLAEYTHLIEIKCFAL